MDLREPPITILQATIGDDEEYPLALIAGHGKALTNQQEDEILRREEAEEMLQQDLHTVPA